jgi:hypothetical protein
LTITHEANNKYFPFVTYSKEKKYRDLCKHALMAEQAAWNKSNLLLKIQMLNTQTLQLFTMNIKIETINESFKNAKLRDLGGVTKHEKNN